MLELILADLHRRIGATYPHIVEPLARVDDKLRDLAEAYADATVELMQSSPPFADVLGPLYMAIASKCKSQALGQYFTPGAVTKLMAMMTVGRLPPVKEKPIITIGEPSAGSGAMLLATCGYILEQEKRAGLRRLELTAIDLDPLCCSMTSAQLLLNWQIHDAPLAGMHVYRGNALGDPSDLQLWSSATADPQEENKPDVDKYSYQLRLAI